MDWRDSAMSAKFRAGSGEIERTRDPLPPPGPVIRVPRRGLHDPETTSVKMSLQPTFSRLNFAGF